MTVTVSSRRMPPVPTDGVRVAYPFTFPVYEDVGLLVSHVTASGTVVALALGTQYTVVRNPNQEPPPVGNPGGTVTTLTALPAGGSVVVSGATAVRQGTDIPNAGPFFGDIIERALDYATVAVQELRDGLDRAMRLSVASPTNINPTLPLPVANRVIEWDASGLQLVNVDAPTLVERANPLPPVSGANLIALNAAALGSGFVPHARNAELLTTAGTGAAYTVTPATAVASYATGLSLYVQFHAASGANPTLQISGLASPPTLVRQDAAGTYSNVTAALIPAGHLSQVVLLSPTQALVMTLPPQPGGTDLNASNLNLGIVPDARFPATLPAVSGANLINVAPSLANVTVRSTNTELGVANRGRVFRATASFTQTFATNATLGNGWWCHYLIDAGATITFDPAGAELFDNVATRAVTGPASLLIVSDGTGLRSLYGVPDPLPAISGANLTNLPAVMGVGRNIRGNTVGTNQIRMIADELILRDPASGQTRRVATVDQTPDINASGANGLDTGTRAANTWYYGWIIETPAGTRAGLISASATAPTMPSGFTFRALVSVVFNNAGNAFDGYDQAGNVVTRLAPTHILVNGQATTETAIALGGVMPPIAIIAHMNVEIHVGRNGNASWDTIMQIRNRIGVQGHRLVCGHVGVGGNSFSSNTVSMRVETPVFGQHVWYLLDNNSSNPMAQVFMHGFTLPIGGQ